MKTILLKCKSTKFSEVYNDFQDPIEYAIGRFYNLKSQVKECQEQSDVGIFENLMDALKVFRILPTSKVTNKSLCMVIKDYTLQNEQKELLINSLLEFKGLDLNDTSRSEELPLDLAIYQGNHRLIHKLICKGAIFDLKFRFPPKDTSEIDEFKDASEVYERFEEAKNSNNLFRAKKILTEYTKDVVLQVNENGTQKEFIEFCRKNIIHISLKYNNFIIGSVTMYDQKYGSYIQETSKMYVEDQKIYSTAFNNVLYTQGSNVDDNIYVVDKKGNLYIAKRGEGDDVRTHDEFLKGKEGNELYGYSKLIACGGHISAQEGKVTYIDNGSGHYKPTFEQLILVVKDLHKKGVLAPDVVIENHITQIKYNLETVLAMDVKIDVPELYDVPNDQYDSLEYYDVLNTGENNGLEDF
jgi:hypothetical protein